MLGHAASLITALPASPAPLLWPVLELPASSLLLQLLVGLEPLNAPHLQLTRASVASLAYSEPSLIAPHLSSNSHSSFKFPNLKSALLGQLGYVQL